MKIEIVEVKDILEWDKFVENSNQNNVFSKSIFLSNWFEKYKIFFAIKKKIPVLGVIVPIKNFNRSNLKAYSYQSIIINKYFDNLPYHAKYKIINDSLEVIFYFLINKFQKFHLSLHPSIEDIRSIQSIKYNSINTKLNLDIEVKYTSYLNNINNIDDLIFDARKVRQQEYKKALKSFSFKKIEDLKIVDDLHKKTFTRQNKKRGPGGDLLFNKILNQLIREGKISMLACEDINKKVVSSTIFLHQNNIAYYLVGASDPNYRNAGVSTGTLFEHFKYLIKNKITIIDLFGTNSPLRGDFKTSFNSKIQTYFEISYNND